MSSHHSLDTGLKNLDYIEKNTIQIKTGKMATVH